MHSLEGRPETANVTIITLWLITLLYSAVADPGLGPEAKDPVGYIFSYAKGG